MKYYLSIAALIKHEAPYLEEWLSSHVMLGVEHFFLCLNDTNDPATETILKPWIGDGFVTLYKNPSPRYQRPFYNSICNHRDTEWMALMDVDEFLYSKTDKDIKDTLAKYDLSTIGGVAVHWLLYGSSGHKMYENLPVVKRFTRRAQMVNPHVKTIARTSHVIGTYANVHSFKNMGDVVDEHFEIQPPEYSVRPGTADILCINHYVTKSLEECKERRARPRADNGDIRSDDFFEIHDCNEVEDLFLRDLIYGP